MTKRAKPTRAWAMFTPPSPRAPTGVLLTHSVRDARDEAWLAIGISSDMRNIYREQGFRVARILVTEERK